MLQGQRVGRHVPDFSAFSENAHVGHALAALEVAQHLQAAELFAAQLVVEEGRRDGAVGFAFQGSRRRCPEERAGLAVAQRQHLAFVPFRFGALDPAHRVVADRKVGAGDLAHSLRPLNAAMAVKSWASRQ